MTVSEMERLLRLLEVVIVRYVIIGGGNTGRFETTCARIARMIFAGEITTATGAFTEFREVFPTDDEFASTFRVKQERNNPKAQYLLRSLENEELRVQLGAMAGELSTGPDLTVEHILPKNPGDEWSSVIEADPSVVEECAYRLGNICLLNQVNKDLGRKGFDEKREAFGLSNLITTKSVSEAHHWDREQIEHRQAHMARRAIATWYFQ